MTICNDDQMTKTIYKIKHAAQILISNDITIFVIRIFVRYQFVDLMIKQ